MGLYLAANCRATLVVVARYRPEAVLEAIARHRITLLGASPTILVGLMGCEAFGSTDLGSLRLCFSGSSALPEATLQRWEAATGCPVAEGYGQKRGRAGARLQSAPRPSQGRVGRASRCRRPRSKIVDVESGARPTAGRRGRRDPGARAAGDARLPQPAGRDSGCAARRLALHRRHRRDRSRRLSGDPRPQEGDGDRRRLQRVPARGRGGALRPPRGA